MKKVAIEHCDNYRLESVKASLKQCFADLGYPADNPFSAVVKPGDKVFIKPNWVASRWRKSCPHVDTLYCVITHPAVIEAVADFVADALQGKGEIIIGDNPSIDADFQELMEFTRIERVKDKYDVPVRIVDLRPLVCDDLKNYGKKDLMVKHDGDPEGTVEVNLGKDSLLYGIDPQRFRGVFDEREETVASHTGETQLYTFAKSLYDADVYISIPKLKTHQKVGATLNLKGLVGSICNKNQLVHWQVGYPEIHGDEYPDKKSYDEAQKATVTHRGAWPGNDTIWRMVGDLYQGMKKKERRYFTVIDGIIAGEGQGPFCPTSKNANTLIAADDLYAADLVAVRYMGFNPAKIKYLNHFLEEKYEDITLDGISVVDSGKNVDNFFSANTGYLDFYVVDKWAEIKYMAEKGK
ncbi:DUF362 domain-containing protein [Butyrivibrio sp. MC2021]|uniref:DUF362 domain-containing protein n=1 Tax=Butyrivibrio sp. MC2021 TaxID=1408306 RepID=UPI00047925F6|nr:DUF362 domain-containing protein [Butyrivibrio sp. MC2021]